MKRVLIYFFLFCGVISGQNDSVIITENRMPVIPLSVAVRNMEINNIDFSSDVDPLLRNINYTTLGILSGVTLGMGLGVHFYQANAWWKDQRQSFRFQDDWEYARWIDKAGHWYGTSLIAHGLAGGLEASNVPVRESIIYGAAGALAFQLFVEIEDGFGPDWGFSPGDAMFDVFGAGYPVLQYYFPVLTNFQVKASYFPAQLTGTNPKTGQTHIVIDDYEGQKFWLSVKPKNLLPESIAEYWPAILCIAAGMGVKDLDGSGGGKSDFYIALDLDIEQVPLYGAGWQFVKSTLNYLHFPMPGIRVTNGVAFFGLCY
ncbi:MAG: DUF2279 domain-containing protein [Ignavibacteriaceae bacterium]